MSISINGNDLRNIYGVLVEEPLGLLTLPPRTWPSAAIPGRAGEQRVGTVPIEAARSLTLNGTILGTTNSDARAKADTLKEALSKDLITIISGDNVARSIQALLLSLSIGSPGSYFVNRHLRVSAVMTALAPFWLDVNASSVAVGTNTQVVLGTAPSRPIITITGGTATAITLTWKHYNGTILQSITITTGLATTDTLVIDCDAMTVKKNGVNIVTALSSGDFLLLDIKDSGSYYNSQWPTMSQTGYIGGTATLSWNKAWR